MESSQLNNPTIPIENINKPEEEEQDLIDEENDDDESLTSISSDSNTDDEYDDDEYDEEDDVEFDENDDEEYEYENDDKKKNKYVEDDEEDVEDVNENDESEVEYDSDPIEYLSDSSTEDAPETLKRKHEIDIDNDDEIEFGDDVKFDLTKKKRNNVYYFNVKHIEKVNFKL